MKATRINKFNKTEKNAKVKEGDCIFPFKWKWKTHNSCVETDKGFICATEISPRRTLSKYGYCEFLEQSKSKKSSKKLKKSSASSSSSSSVPSPSMSKISDKMEKGRKKTLKIISKEKSMKESSHDKVYNADFIRVLGELKAIQNTKGDYFKERAYTRALDEIIKYPNNIISVAQIKSLPGIGATIRDKLNEFVKSYLETGIGKIQAIEKERDNPMFVLTKIYGVGPKKAEQLIKDGYTNIEALRKAVGADGKGKELLNDKQLIGLKYYEDINERIPRAEIEEYEKVLRAIFDDLGIVGSSFEIVGSYRRGAANSGDIDIIVTNRDNNRAVFDEFLDKLIEKKILIEMLSRGKTKSLTIARFPGAELGAKARRLDFLYAPPDEFAFALLYFTGSKEFNTLMRSDALKQGYTLNEHGLSFMKDKIKGKKLELDFPDEKSIFDFLKLKFKNPSERLGTKTFEKMDETEVAVEEEAPVAVAVEEILGAEEVPAVEEKLLLKVKKNKTLKKKQIPIKSLVDKFLAESISGLQSMGEVEVLRLFSEANKVYHCGGAEIMTDNQYDILREYILKHYPDNMAAKEGHAAMCSIEIAKNKVKLPYEMWSMDKIKAESNAVEKWVKKYKGPYVISAKLDGISVLYVASGGEGGLGSLYTRGNGKIGQDISYMIPYLRLPKSASELEADEGEVGLVIRGELIISKEKFKKYENRFANARNFVAGLANQKKIEPSVLADIDFVAYEIIRPVMKPSEQMEKLGTLDIERVKYEVAQTISNDSLSAILIEWRESYKYEIDGIICIDDRIYPRSEGNPEYAFAFKMVLSDQIAEAKVIDVIWKPSKDGYLKPRVRIEPVELDGVVINFATGKNARFIESNKIGLGAIISIIRSGDVIPDIKSVIEPAPEPLFPTEKYVWNDTRVDIMLDDADKETNRVVLEKNIAGFFKILEVAGLGPGIISNIVDAGYDSVPAILALNKADFLKIDGFKNTLATKIHTNIDAKVKSASLAQIAAASNIFGRGFGKRKMRMILTSLPDILTSVDSREEKIKRLNKVSGMARKTSGDFVEGIDKFLEFLKIAKLEGKLDAPLEDSDIEGDEVKEGEEGKEAGAKHAVYGKKIIMTGSKDKLLLARLKNLGADIQPAMTKDTEIVLAKDKEEDTAKAQMGRKLGIIMSIDEFKEKYGLE